MDELWLRLGLIAGALAIAAIATLTLRFRNRGGPVDLEVTGLGPGVYLFTSTACPQCGSARRALSDSLGEDGFAELRWEELPGVFHDLGIEGVPATLVVRADGSGTVWSGKPDPALEFIDTR